MKKISIFFALLFIAFSTKAQLTYNTGALSLNGASLVSDPNFVHSIYPNYIAPTTTWHGSGHVWANFSSSSSKPYVEMTVVAGGSSSTIGASVVSGFYNNFFCFGVWKGSSFSYNNIVAQDINAVGNFYTVSDMTLKTNIAPVRGALNTILALKPVTYQWRDNSKIRTPRVATNPKEIGFVAQDIEKVIPDVVAIYDNQKLVNYQAIIPILTAAIQELTARIEDLEQQLKAK
jgi:hypothetical protein